MQRLKASLLSSPCPRGAPRGLFPRLDCGPGKSDCTQSEPLVLFHGYETYCLSFSTIISIWTVFPRENSVIGARRTQGLPVISSSHKKRFSIVRTQIPVMKYVSVCARILFEHHMYMRRVAVL